MMQQVENMYHITLTRCRCLVNERLIYIQHNDEQYIDQWSPTLYERRSPSRPISILHLTVSRCRRESGIGLTLHVVDDTNLGDPLHLLQPAQSLTLPSKLVE
jgi:hypothetical protein